MSIYKEYFKKPERELNDKFKKIGFLPQEGTKEFEALIKAQKSNVEWKNGSFEIAMDLISDAILLWPENQNYYKIKGEYLYSLSKYELALCELDIYLSFGNQDALIYEKLGICNLAVKEYHIAKSAFSASISILINKKSEFESFYNLNYSEVLSRIYNNLANAKLSIGSKDELNSLTEDCLKAIKISPNYSSPYFTLGLAYLKVHELISVPYNNQFLIDSIDFLNKAVHLGNPKAQIHIDIIEKKYGI